MHTLIRHRLARTRIAWIACLAILFSAFAPLVSHAMQATAPAPAVMALEVCTALGMTTMPLALAADGGEGPEGSAAGKLHKAMNHCGYCVSHAASHGLPPPPAIAFAAALARDVYPPLYYHSPRPLFPWALAQSRAPPSA
jgi:hypothetical protein